MTANRQDVIAGLIFIAIGGYFVADIFISGLEFGTFARLGPAMFPAILAGILIVLGAAIAIKGLIERMEPAARPPIPWRGIIILVPLPIFFGLTIEGLGFVPVVFIVAFVATFASRKTTIRSGLLLAAGLTLFCYVVFKVIAGLPNPDFGRWLRPAIDWAGQIFGGG